MNVPFNPLNSIFQPHKEKGGLTETKVINTLNINHQPIYLSRQPMDDPRCK
jgi:hypothetical protein